MRGLSELELRGLVNLATEPDYTAEDDDPLIDAWIACVDRGVATYYDQNGWRYCNANDLGRLALRVHQAVNP